MNKTKETTEKLENDNKKQHRRVSVKATGISSFCVGLGKLRLSVIVY